MKVKLNLSDEAQLLFLQENLRSFYTVSILDWQYLRFNGHSSLYFTKLDEHLIASQGMLPINLVQKGKVMLSAKSETSFLLPEYRGKDLFEELYNYTIEKAEQDQCELIWGFTALSKVWRNKLKFEVYDGLICETVLQLNFKATIGMIVKKKQPLMNKVKQVTKALMAIFGNKRIPNSSSGFEARELPFHNETLKEIYAVYQCWQRKYENAICIDTDIDYLNWRIVNNPRANYKLIGVSTKDELVAYGILNTSSNYLVEFIVPEEENLKDSLLSILRHMKMKKTHSHVAYWASCKNDYSNMVSSELLRLGARKYENFTMNFVCKRTRHTSFNTENVNDFYINGLWTEGFNI